MLPALIRVVVCCAGLGGPVLVAADPPPGDPRREALASTCAACHGSEGRVVEGSGMPDLRGLDRTYLRTQLQAFREGTRPATVMHQIARGYAPAQLDELAAYFSALPKGPR